MALNIKCVLLLYHDWKWHLFAITPPFYSTAALVAEMRVARCQPVLGLRDGRYYVDWCGVAHSGGAARVCGTGRSAVERPLP
jgi:hypothetical protein